MAQAERIPTGGVLPATRGGATWSILEAGSAGFGLVGALIAIDQAKTQAQEYSLQDPSPGVALAIARNFAQSRGGLAVGLEALPLNENNAGKLARAAAPAAFVVDVQPRYWGYSYFSLDWTHYQVMYWAQVRIIDASNGKVLLNFLCKASTEKEGAPDRNALLANQGALIKTMYTDMAAKCVTLTQAKIDALPR